MKYQIKFSPNILFHLTFFHFALQCRCRYREMLYTVPGAKYEITNFLGEKEDLDRRINTMLTQSIEHESYKYCVGNITVIDALIRISSLEDREISELISFQPEYYPEFCSPILLHIFTNFTQPLAKEMLTLIGEKIWEHTFD